MAFQGLKSWGEFIYGDSQEERFEQLDVPTLAATYSYWQKVTPAGATGPEWAAFKLHELPPDAIPNVLVVDVLRNPLDFRYRFWGTAHAERKRIDRTGQKTSEEHPQGRGPKVAQEYKAVVDRRSPLLFTRLIEFPDGRLPLTQIALRLPISDDGQIVSQIVSITHWAEQTFS